MSRAIARKTRQPAAPVAAAPLPPLDWAMLGRCAGLLLSLLMLGVIATLLFRTRLTTVGGGEMNWDRAVFTSINALTLSGFRLPINPGDLKGLGQLVDYLLIATATISYLLIGGWSLRRIAKYELTDFAITRFTLVLSILAVLLGASLLLGNGIGLLQSLYDATAALGNCGLFLGRLPEVMSLKLQLVLLPLALIGGMAIPVVMEVWYAVTDRRRMTPHTLAALTMAATVYLASLVLLVAFEVPRASESARAVIGSASAFAVNTRSLGLPQDILTLGSATPWLLMLMMAIGASTGGSGGGIKATTVWVAVRDTWHNFRGRAVGPIFSIALLAIAGYGLLVFLAILGLSVAEPTVNGVQLAFTAVSAVSNCGLSHQPINFGSAALYVLSLAMLAGRLWSIAILLACVQQRIVSDVAVG